MDSFYQPTPHLFLFDDAMQYFDCVDAFAILIVLVEVDEREVGFRVGLLDDVPE